MDTAQETLLGGPDDDDELVFCFDCHGILTKYDLVKPLRSALVDTNGFWVHLECEDRLEAYYTPEMRIENQRRNPRREVPHGVAERGSGR